VKRQDKCFFVKFFRGNLGFASCFFLFVEKQRESWEKGEEPGTDQICPRRHICLTQTLPPLDLTN